MAPLHVDTLTVQRELLIILRDVPFFSDSNLQSSLMIEKEIVVLVVMDTPGSLELIVRLNNSSFSRMESSVTFIITAVQQSMLGDSGLQTLNASPFKGE